MSQMVRRSFDAFAQSSFRCAHHRASFLRVFVFFNLSFPNESIFLFFSDQTKTDDARAHTHRMPSWRNGTMSLVICYPRECDEYSLFSSRSRTLEKKTPARECKWDLTSPRVTEHTNARELSLSHSFSLTQQPKGHRGSLRSAVGFRERFAPSRLQARRERKRRAQSLSGNRGVVVGSDQERREVGV